MLRWFMSSCLLLSWLRLQDPSATRNKGSICGTVQDETGAPASLTAVTAIYVSGAFVGILPTSETDENGRYCVTGLWSGEYVMSASDEEKGYPLMSSAFYAEHLPGTRITISPATLHVHSDWRIPFKAGFLRVNVTDAQTGQPIAPRNTELAVRSKESFRYSHGGRPGDAVLLPPNEDILITVSAPGYESWPGGKGPGRLINLQPGARQTIEVALQSTAP